MAKKKKSAKKKHHKKHTVKRKTVRKKSVKKHHKKKHHKKSISGIGVTKKSSLLNLGLAAAAGFAIAKFTSK
jgi:predicted flap endonuclease-1-like 5' DNA nuclease